MDVHYFTTLTILTTCLFLGRSHGQYNYGYIKSNRYSNTKKVASGPNPDRYFSKPKHALSAGWYRSKEDFWKRHSERYYYQEEAIENTPGIMSSQTPIEIPYSTSESLGAGLFPTEQTYPMTSDMQTPLIPQEYQQPYMQPAMEPYPDVATQMQTPYQMQQPTSYTPVPVDIPLQAPPAMLSPVQLQPAPQPLLTQQTESRPQPKLIKSGRFPEAQLQLVTSPSSDLVTKAKFEKHPSSRICAPGPPLKPNPRFKNCLVIGDSIAIGYLRTVKFLMRNMCQVQHAPFARGSGAIDSKHGVKCLPMLLKTTAMEPTHYDAIIFNFGMHDIDYSKRFPEEHVSHKEYTRNLKILKRSFLDTGAKVAFALTTPFLSSKKRNDRIKVYNKAAVGVMESGHRIPVIDLYDIVTKQCGQPADNKYCPIIKRPHDVHYNDEGNRLLGVRIAAAFATMINQRPPKGKPKLAKAHPRFLERFFGNYATDNAITCPDALTRCPIGTTCCESFLSLTGYGCCTMPNAVSCQDNWHCCPPGSVCAPTCNVRECHCVTYVVSSKGKTVKKKTKAKVHQQSHLIKNKSVKKLAKKLTKKIKPASNPLVRFLKKWNKNKSSKKKAQSKTDFTKTKPKHVTPVNNSINLELGHLIEHHHKDQYTDLKKFLKSETQYKGKRKGNQHHSDGLKQPLKQDDISNKVVEFHSGNDAEYHDEKHSKNKEKQVHSGHDHDGDDVELKQPLEQDDINNQEVEFHSGNDAEHHDEKLSKNKKQQLHSIHDHIGDDDDDDDDEDADDDDKDDDDDDDKDDDDDDDKDEDDDRQNYEEEKSHLQGKEDQKPTSQQKDSERASRPEHSGINYVYPSNNHQLYSNKLKDKEAFPPPNDDLPKNKQQPNVRKQTTESNKGYKSSEESHIQDQSRESKTILRNQQNKNDQNSAASNHGREEVVVVSGDVYTSGSGDVEYEFDDVLRGSGSGMRDNSIIPVNPFEKASVSKPSNSSVTVKDKSDSLQRGLGHKRNNLQEYYSSISTFHDSKKAPFRTPSQKGDYRSGNPNPFSVTSTKLRHEERDSLKNNDAHKNSTLSDSEMEDFLINELSVSEGSNDDHEFDLMISASTESGSKDAASGAKDKPSTEVLNNSNGDHKQATFQEHPPNNPDLPRINASKTSWIKGEGGSGSTVDDEILGKPRNDDITSAFDKRTEFSGEDSGHINNVFESELTDLEHLLEGESGSGSGFAMEETKWPGNSSHDSLLQKNKGVENKVVENKGVENKVVENKVVENKVVENKVVENKVVENKGVEIKVVENKVVENKVVENKVVENKLVENKVVENKVVGNKGVENKVVENKGVENKVVENKVVENKVVENKVVENKAVENPRTGKISYRKQLQKAMVETSGSGSIGDDTVPQEIKVLEMSRSRSIGHDSLLQKIRMVDKSGVERLNSQPIKVLNNTKTPALNGVQENNFKTQQNQKNDALSDSKPRTKSRNIEIVHEVINNSKVVANGGIPLERFHTVASNKKNTSEFLPSSSQEETLNNSSNNKHVTSRTHRQNQRIANYVKVDNKKLQRRKSRPQNLSSKRSFLIHNTFSKIDKLLTSNTNTIVSQKNSNWKKHIIIGETDDISNEDFDQSSRSSDDDSSTLKEYLNLS